MINIAFYLPQFHEIPENDNWWGKGFTEWTNVRSAKPQFPGHNQPEIPYNNNYYNLLDPNVQEWQSNLALKYGIDAFCYYHYWFNGKLLLEKPMENMYNNKNIKIPYCICWANETWSRTWDGREADILIEQNYDEDKKAWEKHFNYFLTFFKDDRYLKDNGRPILIIYKPQLITKCREMLDYWRELAKKNGFPDLYLGYQHHSAFDYDMNSLGFDFGIEFEPMFTRREIDIEKSGFVGHLRRAVLHPMWLFKKICQKIFNLPQIWYYDEFWKRIIKRRRADNIMPGAFCAWDNTPRLKNKSSVFYGASPKKFKKYLSDEVSNCKEKKYLFINAWNEWAEGAHLEPDERNGFGYLEAIESIKKSEKV